ncbi:MULTISPECIES: ATP-binding protein [Pseudofrankia]|uniref:ATP-binding protein n=1 Tax=Pseudofrankia TaxID=2994363 RepID=UPI000234C164|nr:MULTISPECIES: ATP-binding protein [Pseudofrankia]OHV42022.1 ATP-binding protein [Pseudofrankia sp. EUN1h]
MTARRTYEVTPSAARLTRSLRDVGYDFPAAVADLVDNSVSAGATHVQVIIEFDGVNSRVFIADDGIGMSENALVEALRFGSRRTYEATDLGRYGLGLKTASLSQGRSVTVVTRRSASVDRIFVRELNLDLIEELDEWLVVAPKRSADTDRARELLGDGAGTVVLWRLLDRVLPEKHPEGGWARRRIDTYAHRTAEHLAIVFHRFLEGLPDGRKVTISVNGEKVRPWDPFAPGEEHCHKLPEQQFEITVGDASGTAHLCRFVLPARTQFSSQDEFERLSGPLNWNRQQGLYVYRADRLVQWGGWAGIRGIDEHTKLARASLDFDTSLDPVFNINVSKMRVSIPPQLRQMIATSVNELCLAANAAYRRSSPRGNMPLHLGAGQPAPTPSADLALAGLALRSAAMQSGHYDALESIFAIVRRDAPQIATALGLTS